MVENKLEWSKHSKKILNTLIKENDNSIGDKELKRVMNFIMENYTENISIEELKNIVGLIELCCVCGEYGIDGLDIVDASPMCPKSVHTQCKKDFN